MKRRLFLVAALALLAISPAALGRATASAQQTPSLVSENISNRFPEGLRFQADVQSGSDITEVVLRYALQPDGVLTRAVARCIPEKAPRTTCSVEVAGRNPYLPPFAELRYSWTITDASGAATDTQQGSLIYADTRFQWAQAVSGNLMVYTYGNADGRPFAAAGRVSLDNTGTLLRAPVTFPVKVIAYNSVNDMSLALPQRSASFSEQVLTLGERVTTDTVIVLNNRGAVETLQHELAHVVTKRAGEGGIGSLPAWLDEGTAVNAQQTPGDGYTSAFAAAAAANQLLSLRSMSSPTGNPADINLFYGEAYYAVRFLIDTYGQDKFAQLFTVFKRGALVDDAMKEAYGKDLLTVENEWRAKLGLPPRAGGDGRREAAPTGTLTPLGVGGIATATASSGAPAQGAGENGGGGPSGLLIALAAAIVAVAVIGAGAGALVRRR